jgi:hypothetical protein
MHIVNSFCDGLVQNYISCGLRCNCHVEKMLATESQHLTQLFRKCTAVHIIQQTFINLTDCIMFLADPEKRRWGAFGYIGYFCLLGNTISFAAHQLKWVGK